MRTYTHTHTHTHAAVEHMKAWGLFQRVGDTQDEKAKQEAGPEL